MAGSNVLASAAVSASYNMILQMTLRLFTFSLNAVILRYISKDLLGLVNVRLMLLYTTILFVSREAFRRACLNSDLNKPWRQIINLLWCIIPIGGVWCLLFSTVWAYSLEQPDPNTIPYYRLSVLVYSLCGLIELLSEPLYITGQMLLFVRLKVMTEGFSLFSGCIITIFLVILYPQWGLLAFCIAQVVSSCLYTVMYYVYFIYYIHNHTDDKFPFKTYRDILPQIIPGKPLISWSLASLTWSFFKQSFLKQILTEGERYVMTLFGVLSFGDQGVYDVIKNLGSLAARFLFLPLEDSGYLFFTQTLTRGLPAVSQTKESITLASEVLHYLLKIVILIGITILIFCYPYSHLALDLYGGQLLSTGTGPSLLRYYCLYVLFLAVNGITECFTFATMSKQEIDKYNHKMLIFSAVFLISSWYLTHPLGSAGFILANCLNMMARIVHSVYYIRRFYKESSYRPLSGLVPALPVLALYLFSFIVMMLSERVLCCDTGWLYRLIHVVIGASFGLAALALIWRCENNLITFVKQLYRSRNEKSGKLQSKDD